MELLFERFLSEERGEWPDIDLDLPSGDRRETVIQYVYERYGRLGAAMTANVITYRGRSAAREVGKTLGLPADTIERLSQLREQLGVHGSGRQPARAPGRGRLRSAPSRASSTSPRLWTAIQDLPRHLGQHSGGMVIAQGRLDGVVPLEPATMPGRAVVQWDKDDCAALGIVKVDLLGLGMMSLLQDALEMIRRRGGDGGSGPSAPERSQGLRHAPAGRHHRRLPGGEPRPDGDPAAPAPRALLRPGGAGGHHPPRAHRGRHGASLPAPPRGARSDHGAPSRSRAHPAPHARRAALPGAAAPHGDGHRRLHRRRGRGAAPRLGLQALGAGACGRSR